MNTDEESKEQNYTPKKVTSIPSMEAYTLPCTQKCHERALLPETYTYKCTYVRHIGSLLAKMYSVRAIVMDVAKGMYCPTLCVQTTEECQVYFGTPLIYISLL